MCFSVKSIIQFKVIKEDICACDILMRKMVFLEPIKIWT
ncbi:hypothetical protein M621_01920 [Serratia plymuthica S13]|uniref:Uncharacterized protein n=1 Tax=Serratia plymuthica S13 TaxID=1348660 RepID=S4YR23_SERPL|nr:hypothetical protein M621_01920 [Serratia plymuthica S13]